jgi:hypothetical protein
MAVIIMLVAIVFTGIHFYNGGDFYQLVPLGTMLVLFWMLDITLHIHAVASPFLAARKVINDTKKKS